MNEYRKIQVNPIDSRHAQNEVAAGRATSTTILAEKHTANEIARVAPTEELQRLKTESEKLARKQSEIAARQAAESAIIAGWNQLIEQRDQLSLEIENGEGRFGTMKAELPQRLTAIREHGWGEPAASLNANLVARYQWITGLERGIADFPEWLNPKKAQLESLNSEIAVFAEKHGIAPGK